MDENAKQRLTPPIDEPSMLDTLETWERHLAMLEALPNSPLKPNMIAGAKRLIAEKRKERPQAEG